MGLAVVWCVSGAGWMCVEKRGARKRGGGEKGPHHLSSIRTAANMPHSILARVNGRTQIDVQDVAECEDLFLDARRSAAVLASESGKGFIS